MPTIQDLLNFADFLNHTPYSGVWPPPFSWVEAELYTHVPDLADAVDEVRVLGPKFEVVDFIHPVADGYVTIQFQRDRRSEEGLNYVGIREVVPKDVVVRKWVKKPVD